MRSFGASESIPRFMNVDDNAAPVRSGLRASVVIRRWAEAAWQATASDWSGHAFRSCSPRRCPAILPEGPAFAAAVDRGAFAVWRGCLAVAQTAAAAVDSVGHAVALHPLAQAVGVTFASAGERRAASVAVGTEPAAISAREAAGVPAATSAAAGVADFDSAAGRAPKTSDSIRSAAYRVHPYHLAIAHVAVGFAAGRAGAPAWGPTAVWWVAESA